MFGNKHKQARDMYVIRLRHETAKTDARKAPQLDGPLMVTTTRSYSPKRPLFWFCSVMPFGTPCIPPP